MTELLRQENGVLYFRCWFADYAPDLYRDVAVSAMEAELSRDADNVFTPDASIEERAKHLAREKFKALNYTEFGHPLPTTGEVRSVRKTAGRGSPSEAQ